ncbi:MAG: hypothetical protein JW395_1826 [Nitrospira sp.]|nr:hypothetical protein [Nitrospira sp.]
MEGLVGFEEHVAEIAQSQLCWAKRHKLRLWRLQALDRIAVHIVEQEPTLRVLDGVDGSRHPRLVHGVSLCPSGDDFFCIEHRHIEHLRTVPAGFRIDHETPLWLTAVSLTLGIIEAGESVDVQFRPQATQLVLPMLQRAFKITEHARLIEQQLPGRRAGIQKVILEHRVAVVQVVAMLEGRDLSEDLQGRHLYRLEEAFFAGAAFVRDEAHSQDQFNGWRGRVSTRHARLLHRRTHHRSELRRHP